MNRFTELPTSDHERVVSCHDYATGLRAIIAVHDTTLGPALGGLRMWDYASEDEALFNVLRLARGMTLKSATAGLNFGGGKAVILDDSRTQKSAALLRRFGRCPACRFPCPRAKKHPDFSGKVKAVDSRDLWREAGCFAEEPRLPLQPQRRNLHGSRPPPRLGDGRVNAGQKVARIFCTSK